MEVVYVGPSDAVVIVDRRGELFDLPVEITALRGVPIEVSDELGAALLEQSVWDAPNPAPAPVLPPVNTDEVTA